MKTVKQQNKLKWAKQISIAVILTIILHIFYPNTNVKADNGDGTKINRNLNIEPCLLGLEGISFTYDVDLLEHSTYRFDTIINKIRASVTVDSGNGSQEIYNEVLDLGGTYQCLHIRPCPGPDPVTIATTSTTSGNVSIEVAGEYEVGAWLWGYEVYETKIIAGCEIPPPVCGDPGTQLQCGSDGGCSETPVQICDTVSGFGCRNPNVGECGLPSSCDDAHAGLCGAWGGCPFNNYICRGDAIGCEPIGAGDSCGSPPPSCIQTFGACLSSAPPGWQGVPCCVSANGTTPQCLNYGSGIYTCGDPADAVFHIPPPPEYSGPIIDFDTLLDNAYTLLLRVAIGVFAIPLGIINALKLMRCEGDPAKCNEAKDGLTAVVLGTLFVGGGLTIIRIAVKTFLDQDI